MEQYIDKSAVVAEIEKRIEETKCMQPKFDQFWAGQISAFKGVLKILDSLEVKEVEEEPSDDLDGYKEVSFELIPYSANIAVGGNEYFLQAKVTDKDLSQIGVSGFLYKLKLKVKA